MESSGLLERLVLAVERIADSLAKKDLISTPIDPEIPAASETTAVPSYAVAAVVETAPTPDEVKFVEVECEDGLVYIVKTAAGIKMAHRLMASFPPGLVPPAAILGIGGQLLEEEEIQAVGYKSPFTAVTKRAEERRSALLASLKSPGAE